MICPRCGVVNASERSSCSRCSGLLVPSPVAPGTAHPIVPITARAELTLRRAGIVSPVPGTTHTFPAGAAQAGPAGAAQPGSTGAAPAGALGPLAPGPSHIGVSPDMAPGEIYLLSTERSTGQPLPPEAPVGAAETALGERRGRMAIGLSGA